jgi:hypothetical protein
MALYQIDVYADARDESPSRTAYASADSKVEAVDLVVAAMEDEVAGERTLVTATSVDTIAPGKIAWVSL